MLVRMVQSITGFRDGVEWPEIGQEIELPEWEAENLIGQGIVKPVPVETPEDGVVVEVAGDEPVAPTRRGRKA